MGYLPYFKKPIKSVKKNIDRLQAIKSAETSLLHALTCKNTPCNVGMCKKLKRIFVHAKRCKVKPQNGCNVCKQFVALCCYHSKYCEDTSCAATFCSRIKAKIQK